MTAKLEVNPWLEMWIRPRKTILSILRFNSDYLIYLLSVIYVLPYLLQAAQNFSLGEAFSLKFIVVGIFLSALLVGLLIINGISLLFYWTGRWFGGMASFHHIRAAIAWSNMPNLVNIAIWIFNVLTFGNILFTRGFVQIPFVGRELTYMFSASFIQAILTVWMLVLMLNALSAVQGFSIWKAILNLLASFFIIMIILSIFSFLISFIIKT